MKTPLYSIILLFLLCCANVHAQEFNCQVSVINPTVQLTNKEPLINLQTSIREFIANKHWTSLNFAVNERIDMSILVNITTANIATADYGGTIQIVATRPAYGTTFNSSTFNFQDKNFNIRYVNNQPMDYVEGTYTNELTAILSFYAYMILGADFDSYSELGGTPYFQKAMNMVNAAQSSSSTGWSALERNDRNRYKLASEYTSDRYYTIRKAVYKYYRKGLDKMADDSKVGLDNILESLSSLKVGVGEIGTGLSNVVNELIDLFSTVGSAEQRCRARELLMDIDITNASKYSDRIKC